MKRNYSLKGKKLFKEVFKKGFRYSSRGITVIILEETLSSKAYTSQDSEKAPVGKDINIGIVVPKKIGQAHARNYEKRKIRAICREFLPDIRNGQRIIIKLEKHYRSLPYYESKNTVASLFSRAGIMQ